MREGHTLTVPRLDPQRLLDDLNDAQREAVLATDGRVAILAAAGTGKTRVISRRTAYAIATDVVEPDQVLVVTFTEKAAREMVDRLRELGLPGVTARTFHAHALSQLRHFWPAHHDGTPLPTLLDSKVPLLVPLARALPGHYRFTPAKDLADEIEWAKSRRLTPTTYERAVAGTDDHAGTRAADPGRPVRPPVRRLRAVEDPRRAHRLRRPADRDDRPARGRSGRCRDRPRTKALVQRRRVPGHEPAPAATARAVARRAPGPVRRRRRGPDHLHVHRRDEHIPDRVRGAPPRRADRHPERQLPILARR